MILVLDIDGTLADATHREHFAEEGDWDSFFDPELVSKDTPIKNALDVFDNVIEMVDEIYFLTGRPEKLRKTTEDWLEEHFGIKPSKDMLIMKKDGDERKSVVTKKEVIEDLFNEEDQLVFIDDEEGNIKMMKNYGLALLAPCAWETFI